MGFHIKRFLYRLISLSIIFLSCVILYKSQGVRIVKNENMFLLQGSSIPVYTALSDNVYNCNLGAISNMYINMIRDNYSLQRIELNTSYIDIVLSNGKVQHRIHYLQNGECTTISNPYEKSNLPFTYINER